jgi:hypothetical protein
MHKFLKNILIFSSVIFILDKVFIFNIILAPEKEKDNRLEKMITGNMNKDIIVLGSSRGARNIIAKQIEDSLGLSTYNLSYPGSSIEFHEFLLRSLLKFNQPPKMIILAVDEPGELIDVPSLVFRFDRLYPLVRYKYINDELISKGEENSFFSKILILSRLKTMHFDFRKQHFSPLDTIVNCGSMPISYQRQDKTFEYQNTIESYQIENESQNKRIAFLKLYELCVENKINLCLVFSPNYKVYDPSFEERIKYLTNCKAYYYAYDMSKKIYKNKSFFYDESHLQTQGAIIFTNEIVQFLINNKKLLPPPKLSEQN